MVRSPGIKIPFIKFHGLGNTWIVADNATVGVDFSQLARSICDARKGIGADGLILVMRPRDPRHDARVAFFNADGSEAEMSGNGIRCAAAFILKERGPKRRLKIETAAGVRTVTTVEAGKRSWTFRVKMGVPVLDPSKIPFRGEGAVAPVVGFPLKTKRGEPKVTVTSMGNPHCSTFVSSFRELDWRVLGREIENHPLFPNRTNVEFVRVISRREIEVRFWERGVGETKSSGTGSCGAVVASVLNGLTGRKVHVRTSAGILEVAWPKGREVTLVGPVVLMKRGVYGR